MEEREVVKSSKSKKKEGNRSVNKNHVMEENGRRV